MSNKTFIIVVCILIAVSIIGITAYLPARYTAGKETSVADFPKVIGEWQGEDMLLSERDYEILETRNLIMRDYKNQRGDSVYLYIVYSAGDRRVVHPPEICYTGGGATIIEKSVITLTDKIKANEFTIEDKDKRQLVVYWFKTADLNTYSYMKQQLKIAVNRMFGKRVSGALIRVSTHMSDNQEDAAFNLVKSFSRQIEPLLVKYVP